MMRQIEDIHQGSKKRYGSPRVHETLIGLGVRTSRKRVARLMRTHDLRARRRRKFRRTTDSNHKLPVAENLLDRQFTAKRPDQVWVGDITYIPTLEGWLYLAVLLDLHSRRVVGWSMRENLQRQLCLDALEMAIEARRPEPGLMHHSDRGSQYASGDYQDRLKDNAIVCSMSRKGECWDNAVAESFFSTLKTELVEEENYATRDEARRSIFDYLEVFYNRQRLHSTLGYKSPVAFEKENFKIGVDNQIAAAA